MVVHMNADAVRMSREVGVKSRHDERNPSTAASESVGVAVGSGRTSPKRQLEAAAAGRSGRRDISERIEDILTQEASPSL